jgi:hypothetical protein
VRTWFCPHCVCRIILKALAEPNQYELAPTQTCIRVGSATLSTQCERTVEHEHYTHQRRRCRAPGCGRSAAVPCAGINKHANFAEWNNRINRMSLDFVVCAKDATVIAPIELDDSSHDRASRVSADAKKQKALASAGISLLRWQCSALPDEATIRRAFAAKNITVRSTETA